MRALILLCVLLSSLTACTTTQIDEERSQSASVAAHEVIVILGRRHNANYETEPDFINCIGRGVSKTGVNVLSELELMNALYPWFEPRTAPLKLRRLEKLMQIPEFSAKIQELDLAYIVWVDGSTETVDSTGSVSCAVGPGGAGCIGFGTWQDDSTYEATVWDIRDMKTIATVSAEAEGTSYMPAVIVPIPIIARVQAAACDGLSTQLQGLFANP